MAQEENFLFSMVFDFGLLGGISLSDFAMRHWHEAILQLHTFFGSLLWRHFFGLRNREPKVERGLATESATEGR